MIDSEGKGNWGLYKLRGVIKMMVRVVEGKQDRKFNVLGYVGQ